MIDDRVAMMCVRARELLYNTNQLCPYQPEILNIDFCLNGAVAKKSLFIF